MNRFHDSVIRPLLDEHRPRIIVEIGAFDGAHTRRLLEWTRPNDAVLHVVDPAPQFDLTGWSEGSWSLPEDPQCKLWPYRSLEVLPRLGAVDMVLIDGDHNWYTVVRELAALGRRRHWPLVVLHDVEWPYARRDCYFDPDSIPAEFRQPIGHGGVVEGVRELVPDGLNAGAPHALHEGGPRNGVLTALEDFLHVRPDLRAEFVSGNHGLAIVTSYDNPRIPVSP